MRKLTFILILISAYNTLYAISEKEKISLLLNLVEKSNYTFIRNGNKYTSTEARDHLEMKLNRSWITIDSAKKFIKYIATKSFLSGKYYTLVLPNGSVIKAVDWLNLKLAEIEKNAEK